MADPLGGDVGDPGVPTTYIEDVTGGPLGGNARDLRAPTTYVEDFDGDPPWRQCQRPRGAHQLC
jgi:hypothetical protein